MPKAVTAEPISAAPPGGVGSAGSAHKAQKHSVLVPDLDVEEARSKGELINVTAVKA